MVTITFHDATDAFDGACKPIRASNIFRGFTSSEHIEDVTLSVEVRRTSVKSVQTSFVYFLIVFYCQVFGLDNGVFCEIIYSSPKDSKENGKA